MPSNFQNTREFAELTIASGGTTSTSYELGGTHLIGILILSAFTGTRLIIEGSLDGELTIENLLILRSTARIKGDIQTLKLNIEEGAFFEGACVMKSPVSTNNTFNADIAFD